MVNLFSRADLVVTLLSDQHQLLEKPAEPDRFPTPEDRGTLNFVLTQTLDRFWPDGNLAILMSNWGVFPNHENQDIYRRIRTSQGLAPNFPQLPAEVISQDDKSYALASLTIAVGNFWDVSLIFPNQNWAIFFSHDEYFGPLGNPEHVIKYINWLNQLVETDDENE